MKNANGTGSVTKIKGNHRKPYCVRVSIGTVYDEQNDRYIHKRKVIGYFATQAEARAALSEFNANPLDPAHIDVTVNEIWQKIKPGMEAKLSKSRIDAYTSAYKYLEPVSDMRLRDVRLANLQSIIDECPHKSTTKSNIKTVIRKIYEYALKNDYIQKDYSQYIEFDIDPVTIDRQIFTSEEIAKMWARSSEWPFAMMLILIYSGMRINEFLSNSSANFDTEKRLITIPSDIAKNKTSARTIPMHSAIVPLVKSFKALNSPYLAVKPSGYRITYKNFTGRDLGQINAFLGANHKPHDTRHTFSSRARECGLDNLVIQRILGHTPDTLNERVYTHISLDELCEEIEKLNF